MNVSVLRPKKIAVIGSGISGLSCAWLLNKAHQVTLFETEDRLGGHSNTVRIDLDGHEIPVDTGFIVYNPVNYPNLVKFFEHLDVASSASDMSFAVSIDRNHRNQPLEYSGSGLTGLFAQKSNLVSLTFWRLLRDLLRFYRNAERLSLDPALADLSLGDLLRREGYSRCFIYDHLLPMCAAIWSTPAQQMLDYPALSFLRFCRNHGLVQLQDRPQWRTLAGGSVRYVDKIAAALQGKIRLNCRVQKVIRHQGGVTVEQLHGRAEQFDEVVLACHADQALALLDQPSVMETHLLSSFKYQRNQAFLHLDKQLMPRDRRVWSSWNYMASGPDQERQKVSVSYWMNRLQPLATDTPIFVSLNPNREPARDKLIRSFFYDHPCFDLASLRDQPKLWQLQGQQNTWFCGAYFGYGFHEDGIQSGLAVAEQLGGVPRPWHLEQPNSRICVTHAPLKGHAAFNPKERLHGHG